MMTTVIETNAPITRGQINKLCNTAYEHISAIAKQNDAKLEAAVQAAVEALDDVCFVTVQDAEEEEIVFDAINPVEDLTGAAEINKLFSSFCKQLAAVPTQDDENLEALIQLSIDRKNAVCRLTRQG